VEGCSAHYGGTDTTHPVRQNVLLFGEWEPVPAALRPLSWPQPAPFPPRLQEALLQGEEDYQ